MARDRSEFKVPIGIAHDGRCVRPNDVSAAEARQLRCPGCDSKLAVRGGSGRTRRHFYHPVVEQCSEETAIHKSAKHLVQEVLRNSIRDSGPAITVHRVCARCSKGWAAPLRVRFDAVEMEHELDVGRVADVAVLRAGKPVFIVEICATHEVDDDKAAALAGLSCAELQATAVLEDALNWRPTERRAKRVLCPACRERMELYAEAGIPTWVDDLSVDPKEGNVICDLERSGRIIRVVRRLTARDPMGPHVLFNVQVASLGEDVSAKRWSDTRAVRKASVSKQLKLYPRMPRHVRVCWEIVAALQQFGGQWTIASSEQHLPERDDDADDVEERWTKIRRIALETEQLVPQSRESPYWVEPYRCFADDCRAEMLVYAWGGRGWMTDDPPPEPRPHTIQHRTSQRAGGKYWANVCPACDRLQGDNYVYEPLGPLPARLSGRRGTMSGAINKLVGW